MEVKTEVAEARARIHEELDAGGLRKQEGPDLPVDPYLCIELHAIARTTTRPFELDTQKATLQDKRSARLALPNVG